MNKSLKLALFFSGCLIFGVLFGISIHIIEELQTKTIVFFMFGIVLFGAVGVSVTAIMQDKIDRLSQRPLSNVRGK
jgi:hypothetical protein